MKIITFYRVRDNYKTVWEFGSFPLARVFANDLLCATISEVTMRIQGPITYDEKIIATKYANTKIEEMEA